MTRLMSARCLGEQAQVGREGGREGGRSVGEQAQVRVMSRRARAGAYEEPIAHTALGSQ
jgi:hypothetical protein